MSRVRNADQFLTEFRRRRDIYERHYIRLCENIQQQYAHVPNPSHADAAFLKVREDVLLEAHARVGMINALLGALNWRMDVSVEDDCANLIPEAPLMSVSSHTRRFLDYFGVEHNNGQPLLIVESKRPSSELPERSVSLRSHSPPLQDSFATDPEYVVAEVIAQGLTGHSIPGEWNDWLTTLRDYVRSVQQQSGHTPCRVVITNGNWLVLFLDPADAFMGNSICDPTQILVYGNRDAIERRHAELFCALEHQSLLSQTRALTLGELRFAVAPGTIDLAMHGLRLMYIEEPGFFELSPVIKVMPIVFLHTCYRSWLCVESRCEERLPHAASELSTHLDRIREMSRAFLQDIERALGTQLPVASLAKHYADAESFEAVRGVVECSYYTLSRAQEFIVVTGEHTHYLIPEPTVCGCPHHSWANSQAAGVAAPPSPVETRKTGSPKSFFISGEQHHCTHREVATAKAHPITAFNRDWCGPRSGQEGQAFCEIWRFEEHLCCRTCAFEEVCAKAQAFVLPCQRPVTTLYSIAPIAVDIQHVPRQ